MAMAYNKIYFTNFSFSKLNVMDNLGIVPFCITKKQELKLI